MAKIKVVGNKMFVTSEVKTEDIKLLQKYRPDALSLFRDGTDGVKVPEFTVCTTNGNGEIGVHGAAFGATAMDGSGLAIIVKDLPADVTPGNVAEKVADIVGVSILNLNKVEAQIGPALEEVAAEKADILANITVE